MTQGSLGRFAPRGPNGRFLPINSTGSWVNAWRRGQSSNYVANPGNAAAYARWSTASKWVGRAGTVLTVGTSAISQWQQDANDPSLTTAERVGRAGTAGVDHRCRRLGRRRRRRPARCHGRIVRRTRSAPSSAGPSVG